MIVIVRGFGDGCGAVDMFTMAWHALVPHRPKATFSQFCGAAAENLPPTFCRPC